MSANFYRSAAEGTVSNLKEAQAKGRCGGPLVKWPDGPGAWGSSRGTLSSRAGGHGPLRIWGGWLSTSCDSHTLSSCPEVAQ